MLAAWNSALSLAHVWANGGQLCKGEQNTNFGEKIEGNSDGVKLSTIIKLTEHLKIVKNDKLYEHAFLNITKEGFKFV